MIVNINLENARKKSGLKKSEVAKKAKISYRSYQYIERDGRIPNARTAILIAKAVGSSVEELFAAADDTSNLL